MNTSIFSLVLFVIEVSSSLNCSLPLELSPVVELSTLAEVLKTNKDSYRVRKPFPHMVQDGMFSNQVLQGLLREIPENPSLGQDGCISGSSGCFKWKLEDGKHHWDDESKFGPMTVLVFGFLKSSIFVKFLENLTGIPDLIPDPHYVGSGIHQTRRGGLLAVHADFNHIEKYKLFRRVNTFLYLNPEWTDSYGGHLELWSRDLKCAYRILPTLGRLVVFSSTDFSYHGHPHPLQCPQDRSRRSLALYYYTISRPSEECVNNRCDSYHTTLFQTPLCSQYNMTAKYVLCISGSINPHCV